MNPSPSSLVAVARPQAGVALLTLDRPHALNALSMALRRDIVSALAALAEDESLRCLVVTGAGRAFCAGLDLVEIGTHGVPPVGGEDDDPIAAIERFPLPVIGAINGAAVTGGFELALACDILIASSKARFADTHARIGVIPGWGLSQKLPRLIGMSRAKEMAFSGNFVDAATALQWGLVNRVVPAERLLADACGLAADIAGALPDMLRGYKRLIDDGTALPLGEARELERQRSAAHLAATPADDLAARRGALMHRGRTQSVR